MMTDVLQPLTDPHDAGAVYVSSTPERVLWGRLPCREDACVACAAAGEDIVVDTVSHEGLLPDQGGDPMAYFTARGVRPDQVLTDAVDIAARCHRDEREDGPHVVTGPVRIEGAHPGDLLAVSIRRLERRVPYGVVSTRHDRGVLAGDERYDADYGQFCWARGDRAVFASPEDGEVVDSSGRSDGDPWKTGHSGAPSFPLNPFLGIVGVMPDSAHRPSSIPPAAYGGNIDLRELTENSTLFIPVQVEGAGLYVGDPHFAQGNGEVALTALEASLRATLHVEVISRSDRSRVLGMSPLPFAYAHRCVIALGMDRDLNRALRDCVGNAVHMIHRLFGVPERQAYLLLSAAADCDVTQAVDIVKGAHAMIDVDMFRDCPAYGAAMDFLHDFEDGSLTAAVQRYETALVSNDVDAMKAIFADDPDGVPVVRSDNEGPLVGHRAIADFRARRGKTPGRTLRRRIIRTLSPDAASVVSRFDRDSGGTITQTQVWRRYSGVWHIVDAHLTYPSPAMDSRIWRVVGDPLVPPSKPGPLDSMSVAVKDLFAIHGFSVGAGNPDYRRESPVRDSDADAVRMLRDAGASVRGIAQTDEFAYSLAGTNIHYGTPPNPRAPGRISGGSSSGPASAVACGQADIGLGTDTAGSIRIPAAYQGLWGIRTTHDRVSRAGVHPLSSSFDTVGVLARTHGVLAAATSVLVGVDAVSAIEPVMLLSPGLCDHVESDVSAAFSGFVQVIRSRSAYRWMSMSIDDSLLNEWLGIFQTVRGYEAWRFNGAWVASHRPSLDPGIAARFDHDSHIPVGEYRTAIARLSQVREAVRAELGSRPLLIPTASSVAPLSDPGEKAAQAIERARRQTLLLTSLAGVAGLPAVNIPLVTDRNLPCGACLIGPAGSDNALVALAGRLSDCADE